MVREQKKTWDLYIKYPHNQMVHNPVFDKNGTPFYACRRSMNNMYVLVYNRWQAQWVERRGGIPLLRKYDWESPEKLVIKSLKEGSRKMRTCDVKGCDRTAIAGVQPAGRGDLGMKVCAHHLRHHNSKKHKFSLWKIMGYNPKRRIKPKPLGVEPPANAAVSDRKSKRRSKRWKAQLAKMQEMCSHPKDRVVWEDDEPACGICQVELDVTTEGKVLGTNRNIGKENRSKKRAEKKHRSKQRARQRKKTGGKSVGQAIYDYLDEKGSVYEASYRDCLKIAQSIKPDTKFNKGHFGWYKNQWQKRQNGQ